MAYIKLSKSAKEARYTKGEGCLLAASAVGSESGVGTTLAFEPKGEMAATDVLGAGQESKSSAP